MTDYLNIRRDAAFLSLMGTLILILIISIKDGGINLVLREFPIFILGGVRKITIDHSTFLSMFTVILATVSISLICSMGGGILSNLILGDSHSHLIEKMLNNLKEGNFFFSLFVLVVAEELFARWFFLGVLTRISFLSSTFMFYILFLIGNGIWSLIHLHNFEYEEDRHILRVLPQFIGGAFFTFIFVKYGILASILTHFAYNAVLFAYHKIHETTIDDVACIIYAGICATVSYWLMRKPLSDILQWFTDKPSFTIPGWELWDYIKLWIFITSILTIVFGVLLYDRRKSKEDFGLVTKILLTFVAMPITVVIVYGLYYIMGMLTENVPYRILLIAIMFAFFKKDSSGSAMAETFWTTLLGLYVIISIIVVLGFTDSVWAILITTIINFPITFLTKENEQ